MSPRVNSSRRRERLGLRIPRRCHTRAARDARSSHPRCAAPAAPPDVARRQPAEPHNPFPLRHLPRPAHMRRQRPSREPLPLPLLLSPPAASPGGVRTATVPHPQDHARPPAVSVAPPLRVDIVAIPPPPRFSAVSAVRRPGPPHPAARRPPPPPPGCRRGPRRVCSPLGGFSPGPASQGALFVRLAIPLACLTSAPPQLPPTPLHHSLSPFRTRAKADSRNGRAWPSRVW